MQRDENPAKKKKLLKKYRWQQEYRLKNRDKINAAKRAYYKQNKTRIKKKIQIYYAKNRLDILSKKREYRERIKKIDVYDKKNDIKRNNG